MDFTTANPSSIHNNNNQTALNFPYSSMNHMYLQPQQLQQPAQMSTAPSFLDTMPFFSLPQLSPRTPMMDIQHQQLQPTPHQLYLHQQHIHSQIAHLQLQQRQLEQQMSLPLPAPSLASLPPMPPIQYLGQTSAIPSFQMDQVMAQQRFPSVSTQLSSSSSYDSLLSPRPLPLSGLVTSLPQQLGTVSNLAHVEQSSLPFRSIPTISCITALDSSEYDMERGCCPTPPISPHTVVTADSSSIRPAKTAAIKQESTDVELSQAELAKKRKSEQRALLLEVKRSITMSTSTDSISSGTPSPREIGEGSLKRGFEDSEKPSDEELQSMAGTRVGRPKIYNDQCLLGANCPNKHAQHCVPGCFSSSNMLGRRSVCMAALDRIPFPLADKAVTHCVRQEVIDQAYEALGLKARKRWVFVKVCSGCGNLSRATTSHSCSKQ